MLLFSFWIEAEHNKGQLQKAKLERAQAASNGAHASVRAVRRHPCLRPRVVASNMLSEPLAGCVRSGGPPMLASDKA